MSNPAIYAALCSGPDRSEVYLFQNIWNADKPAARKALGEAVTAYLAAHPEKAESFTMSNLDEIPGVWFLLRGLSPLWSSSQTWIDEFSLDKPLSDFYDTHKGTLLERHELYVDLVDIQSQLENGIGDAAELEKRRGEIFHELVKAGLDPEDEPEWLMALSDREK